MAVTTRESPLVAGASPGGGPAPMARVTVVRAFCIGGTRQEPGSIVEVPVPLARELTDLGKAAPVKDEPAVTPVRDEPDPEPEKPKGMKYARK
jgi:hypothetical protein